MTQYVERKFNSKNIPPNIHPNIPRNIPQNIPRNIHPNITSISYKYPHNRLSENHDLMLLHRIFSIKIDVISNELLWHSILRADAASY